MTCCPAWALRPGEPSPRGGRPPFDRHGPLPPTRGCRITTGLIASVVFSALLA